MCAIIILLLGFAGFFGFAGFQSAATTELPMALPTEDVQLPEVISCASAPADQDVADVLALFGDTFAPAEWEQQITSTDTKTKVTWQSTKYGAIAYLEYLHYDCGVSQSQIDDYFSPEGFDVLLSSYSSHELTAACESDGVRLFEFEAAAGEYEYHILYWVEQTSPTRVAGLMLVFPTAYPAQQAEYAGKLYSQLSTCEAAAG